MSSSFNLSIYELSERLDARWLKIFHQNSTGNRYFDKATNQANYNTNDPYLFSILKLLPYIRKFDDFQYEFLLEYPGHSGYNRWSQTVEPHKVISPHGKDIGFKEIDLTWKGYLFSGLGFSQDLRFYMDCTVNESLYAHYAIGSFAPYASSDIIPGPRINDENGNRISGFDVREVTLWIRVRDFYQLFNIPCTCQKFRIYSVHYFIIFITVVIFPLQK